ncbi:P-loop containing nucleoside triphosphate hydrolase protein [Mycena sanguinolenta]|nr:P-loop containing nucleoside triphosphate hydrolase protein [Mycena sanguinolenta]
MGASVSKTNEGDFNQPKTFDIAVIGPEGAGKTSLVRRLLRPRAAGSDELPQLPQMAPTIGYISEEVPYGKHTLTFWDFSVQAQVDVGRDVYWNVHAFIFMLDASLPERLEKVKEMLWSLSEEIRRGGYYLSTHPILVLANKIDKMGPALDTDGIYQALDISELASRGTVITLKSVSAMSDEGVHEAMQWLLDNVSRTHIEQHDGTKRAIMRVL